MIIDTDRTVRIEFVNAAGDTKVLKESLSLLQGEVIDASVMSRSSLCSFLTEQLSEAVEQDVLFPYT